MYHPNYQVGTPSAQYPPPYSGNWPHNQPPPPFYETAIPAMPTQHQPYYPLDGTVPGQGPLIQSLQHTTVIVPVQPTYEPDHLAYSIFTMLCCCLPLGIAALVYSIQTRDANRMGNNVVAQRNSRMALKFAHSALGMGVVLATVFLVVNFSI